MPLLFDNSLHYPKNAEKKASRSSSTFDFPLRYQAFLSTVHQRTAETTENRRFSNVRQFVTLLLFYSTFRYGFPKTTDITALPMSSDLRQFVTVSDPYSTFHYGFPRSAENTALFTSGIRLEQVFQKMQHFLFDISLRLFDISLRLFDIPLQGLDFSLRLFDIPLRGSFL